jgi:cytochrome P450
MIPLLPLGLAKHAFGPDALEFRPERWMGGAGGAASPASHSAAADGSSPRPGGGAGTEAAADNKQHSGGGSGGPPDPLTFLAGPRDCIGQNLAKLELQVVLATLLGRFRFGPGPELAQELAVAAATGQPPVAALHALAGVHITLQPLSGRMEFSVTPRARPDVLNE